jgi:hypothetical protein
MIPENVIEAVRCLKRNHPYRGTYDIKSKKFGCLLNVLSYYYSVPVPSLYIVDDSKPMTNFDKCIVMIKGCYNPSTCNISLRKFSVISLLHEFRHHLQCVLGFPCDNIEDDANIWSHLIYRKVFSRNFQRLKENGELNHTTVEI